MLRRGFIPLLEASPWLLTCMQCLLARGLHSCRPLSLSNACACSAMSHSDGWDLLTSSPVGAILYRWKRLRDCTHTMPACVSTPLHAAQSDPCLPPSIRHVAVGELLHDGGILRLCRCRFWPFYPPRGFRRRTGNALQDSCYEILYRCRHCGTAITKSGTDVLGRLGRR